MPISQHLTDSVSSATTLGAIQKIKSWLLFSLLALLLSACGGGNATFTGGGSGSVGIVLTDAPSSDFLAVNMTITQILLLSDDENSDPVTLFQGEETINLLSLRDHAELFALNNVPAGSYSKIRLILKQPNGLELVLPTILPSGENEKQYPHLPGNGKIDLNPRGNFDVKQGEVIYAHIDLDAEKSIHAHVNGNGNGQYEFRPVIFVDVIGDDFAGKLVRRTGYIHDLASDQSQFALCDTPVSEPPATTTEVQNDDSMGCMTITTQNASLFAVDGLPMPLTGLVENANVTAIGFLHSDTTPGDSGIIQHAKLSAEVIEHLDGMDNVETLDGTVATAPADALSNFDLTLADSTTVTSLLQEGTKVFGRDGTYLDYTDILPSTLASVDGVRDMVGGSEMLRSSLVILDTAPSASLEKLTGTVNTVNSLLHTVDVSTDGGDQMVQLTTDTVILVIAGSSTSSVSSAADISALVTGAMVEMYGKTDALGYFVPQVILVTG